ncbi:MAG: SOS response-associated peptidase [Lachnospiraceae bacterium]|nr:SOS response-associated peptidase [Lachnospiraceae bacterium]
MCGRYSVDNITEEIEKSVCKLDGKVKKKYTGDVLPSRSAVVITGRKPFLTAEEMVWGFSHYQKNGLLINARSETVLEKKMFRESVLHRRCIIPASQFYEWDSDKNKVTFLNERKPVLYMAGFFNRFQDEDHFIILTTSANASVSPVHPRMPLIVERDELEEWIYNDAFLEFALHKVPDLLDSRQEYEQQSLF